MSTTRSQFAHPRGVLGWLAGMVMALENRKRNELAVEWLAAQPESECWRSGSVRE